MGKCYILLLNNKLYLSLFKTTLGLQQKNFKMSSARLARSTKSRLFIYICAVLAFGMIVYMFHGSQLQLDDNRKALAACNQQTESLSAQLQGKCWVFIGIYIHVHEILTFKLAVDFFVNGRSFLMIYIYLLQNI